MEMSYADLIAQQFARIETLIRENERLKAQIEELKAKLAEYDNNEKA